MTSTRRLTSGLVVGMACCAVAVPVAAQTANREVASVDALTPLSAYGGRLVWSTYDPSTRTFSLTTRAGGETATLPVAPRPVPFDADLGPGVDGTPVVVYSRCQREPDYELNNDRVFDYTSGGHCDVYRYDFATQRESPVRSVNRRSSSETVPTIYGRRIAFARTSRPSRGRSDGVARLLLNDGVRTRELRRGSLGVDRGPVSPRSLNKPRPSSMDLSADRLAFRWFHVEPRRCPGKDPNFRTEAFQNELWSVSLRSRRGRLVGRGCEAGRAPQDFVGPAVDRGRLYYIPQPGPGLLSFSARAGTRAEGPNPENTIPERIAKDGSTLFYLVPISGTGRYSIRQQTRPQ